MQYYFGGVSLINLGSIHSILTKTISDICSTVYAWHCELRFSDFLKPGLVTL